MRNNNKTIYYSNMWNDNIPVSDVKNFCRWAKKTNTKVCWQWSYAHPTNNFPLIDRGYILTRNGKFSAEAYNEFKDLFNIPTNIRVGYNDLEAIYNAVDGRYTDNFMGNEYAENMEEL